jgi:acetyl-CoA carboxylase carboxyl transferase subunit alpha
LEVCPQVTPTSSFIGAAAISQVRFFNMHPTGRMHARGRLDSLMGDDAGIRRQRDGLQQELTALRAQVYAGLTPWQKTLVARHPRRPYTLDYLRFLVTGFVEVHGDRKYADDPAIVAGFGEFRGRQVVVIGHQKGRDTKEKVYRNFGMPRPEGYRKALRVMAMAEKFGRPILTFVDTPGAYPGIGAEERGQAEAIAHNLREMAKLRVPVLVTVTGEGGSGGALALGVGDRVNMLEFSVYSVISPEGCASILWKDATQRQEAAEALRLTSRDLAELGVIDRIVAEPQGGAHRDPDGMAILLARVLVEELAALQGRRPEELVAARIAKFGRMGIYREQGPA